MDLMRIFNGILKVDGFKGELFAVKPVSLLSHPSSLDFTRHREFRQSRLMFKHDGSTTAAAAANTTTTTTTGGGG